MKETVVNDDGFVEALSSKIIAGKEREDALKRTDFVERYEEITRGHEHLLAILKKNGKVRLGNVNKSEMDKTEGKKADRIGTEVIYMEGGDANKYNSLQETESGFFYRKSRRH